MAVYARRPHPRDPRDGVRPPGRDRHRQCRARCGLVGVASGCDPGDDGPIVIGENTSIQDGAVIHTTAFTPTRIGSNVTVGHLAHLEGCIVHDWALVGSGSIVLHNAVIHEHALVGGADGPGWGGGAALFDGTRVPAKIREGVLDEFHARLNVDAYVARGEQFRTEMRRID